MEDLPGGPYVELEYDFNRMLISFYVFYHE